MFTTRNTTAAIAAALIGLAGTTSALAASDGHRLNVPKDQWLTAAQVTEKLTAAGYTVREVEVDDGAYEIEATKDGVKHELHVHPATGDVLTGYDD
jgi:hypothetical protein